MTLVRITAGINKVEDAGKMDAQIRSAEALWRVFPTTVARLSHVPWLGSPAGNREPAGLIVVWQMCYPVQHVLDAAAMASSATFRGILLRAVSGCCYNNGGLRNRRWANAITKHGGKGEWQTSVQSLPSCKEASSTPVPAVAGARGLGMWRMPTSIGTLTALRSGAAITFEHAAMICNKVGYYDGHQVSTAVRAFLIFPAVIGSAALVHAGGGVVHLPLAHVGDDALYG